jgi:hypothetical protein
MYAEMPPSEKEQWNAHAEADKNRYLAELKNYVPPPGYDIKGDAIEFAQILKARKGSAGTKDMNAPRKSELVHLLRMLGYILSLTHATCCLLPCSSLCVSIQLFSS